MKGTASEAALYNELRDNRLRHGLRLEQERIGFGWLTTTLATLAALAVRVPLPVFDPLETDNVAL